MFKGFIDMIFSYGSSLSALKQGLREYFTAPMRVKQTI